MKLSVLVVCLNEAERLGPLLDALGAEEPEEVIVADGGSSDGSDQLARQKGAMVLTGERGRARQFNAAARQATGEALLLLHADCLPQPGWAAEVRRLLSDPQVALGAFRFATDGQAAKYRWLEAAVHLRSALWSLPYGDQGFFLRRSVFEALEGFRDMPLMEDYDLVKRARKLGRVATSPLPLVTSARRWERAGVLAVAWTNQKVIWGHALGRDLNELKKMYRRLDHR